MQSRTNGGLRVRSSTLWHCRSALVSMCAAALALLSLSARAADPCAVETLVNPNSLTNGTLVDGACRISDLSDPTDTSFLDLYRLTLTAPGTLSVRMASTVLDSIFFVTEPTLSNVFAQDD